MLNVLRNALSNVPLPASNAQETDLEVAQTETANEFLSTYVDYLSPHVKGQANLSVTEDVHFRHHLIFDTQFAQSSMFPRYKSDGQYASLTIQDHTFQKLKLDFSTITRQALLAIWSSNPGVIIFRGIPQRHRFNVWFISSGARDAKAANPGIGHCQSMNVIGALPTFFWRRRCFLADGVLPVFSSTGVLHARYDRYPSRWSCARGTTCRMFSGTRFAH
jgi:hypothetical protein